MSEQIDKTFIRNVADILKQAKQNAKTAVNLSMVYAYFEIGRIIVEEEQNGNDRAAYGKQILQELSDYLTAQFGKGFSVGNLKNIRQFYRVYAHDQIGETVFSQFENLPATKTGRRFYLSWSHYLKHMRIDTANERHFYEIEAVKNDWSLSELKRQFNSALYERLALSREKDKVYALALEGQALETPADVVNITLCKEKNNAIVEMTLPENNSQIFASKYETILPSKEELKKLLTEHLDEGDGGEES